MNYIIKPENTAISNGTSKNMRELVEFLDKDIEILDFGSGKLRNSNYLNKTGFKNVSILDTPIQVSKYSQEEKEKFKNVFINNIEGKYDLILCNYVLNVIPNKLEREEIIKDIYLHLKDKGIALFEVRTNYDINCAKNKMKYLDGFLIGKGNIKTFQKPYELKEIVVILNSHHFKVIRAKEDKSSICVIVKKEVI